MFGRNSAGIPDICKFPGADKFRVLRKSFRNPHSLQAIGRGNKMEHQYIIDYSVFPVLLLEISKKVSFNNLYIYSNRMLYVK